MATHSDAQAIAQSCFFMSPAQWPGAIDTMGMSEAQAMLAPDALAA
jgi:hypothetical protein